MKRALLTSLITLSILIAAYTTARSENWPGFRGPTGLGYTDDKRIPAEWGGADNKNVIWKAKLRGQGHASPIVWGEYVITSTVSWPAGADRASIIPEQHITCYRATNGQELWDTQVPAGPWRRTDFRSGAGGGYAAVTPATDGALIYCGFASSVIAALDMHGKLVWKHDITPYTFDVTYSCSPVLYGDTVLIFCPCNKPGDSRLVALNKRDGTVKWRRDYPNMGFAHSTPLLITVGGKQQLLLLASGMRVTDDALLSVNPANGNVIWSCRGAGDAASPAFNGSTVYFDSGRGGLGVAVAPTGTGDISKSHVKWTVTGLPEAISSPVFVGKYMYRLMAPGALRCWDAASGKELYTQRLEGITSTWASPVVDGNGRLYFATAGKSYVVQAGPTFKLIAVNDLEDANHPSAAVSEGKLYLEGMKFLYCIGGTSP